MKEKTNRFTAEERMRCAKVAKVFEAFMWESDFMWASDAGPFGYTVLCDYYKDEFSDHKTYTSAKELFERLWIEYLYYKLLEPVKGTPLADLDYEELYARLSEKEKSDLKKQRAEFIEAAGLDNELSSDLIVHDRAQLDKLPQLRITKKFTSNTSMEINDDVIKVFEFIASPDSVQQMIKSTEIGDPALTGIVHELEARFADCEGFPLNHKLNRRNVGWMIKFVMREYGYTTIKNTERTRIPKKTGSVYFKNAAVYHLTNSNSDYKIIPLTGVLYRSLTTEDLYIKEDDPDYEQILKGVSGINKRLRELRLDEEFVSDFLNNLGFRGMISVEDVCLMFDGSKVPGQELYDALNRMIAFFNMTNYQRENEKDSVNKELSL